MIDESTQEGTFLPERVLQLLALGDVAAERDDAGVCSYLRG